MAQGWEEEQQTPGPKGEQEELRPALEYSPLWDQATRGLPGVNLEEQALTRDQEQEDQKAVTKEGQEDQEGVTQEEQEVQECPQPNPRPV